MGACASNDNNGGEVVINGKEAIRSGYPLEVAIQYYEYIWRPGSAPLQCPYMVKKVVVIGGGSGTSVVLNGLKQHPVELTAIVSVADSGGSTGRLRDEFGFQPVGDLRQSLAALAETGSEQSIKDLLLYRFNHGTFEGHSLGNLILTALQDITGSTGNALRAAHEILQIAGQILPVTEENVQLVVEYATGEYRIGEHILDEPATGPCAIKRVLLSPRAKMYQPSRRALQEADLIVIGPGDYFGSLMAALAVSDIRSAFARVKAPVAYVVNLMTRSSQTAGYTATRHVTGIEKRLGRRLDHIFLHSGDIPADIKKHYAAEGEQPVSDDLGDDPRVVRAPVVSVVPYHQNSADKVKRSLLRHDSTALAKLLLRAIKA